MNDAEKSQSKCLQEQFFTSKMFHPGHHTTLNYQKLKRDRMRCVFSLIRQLVRLLLQGLFQVDHCEHVINCLITDDASTRVRQPSGVSNIVTICDTVQTIHIRNGSTEGQCRESVNFPTPLVIMSGSKTGDIHGGRCAFAVSCATGVGHLLQCMGLDPASLPALNKSPWQTSIWIGDSLKANDAAWRVERALFREQQQKKKQESSEDQTDPRQSASLGLRVKCILHQMNLVRKPIVLTVPNYWATLVRLSHMFEQQSFRRSFAGALLHVLQEKMHSSVPWLFHLLFDVFLFVITVI